MTQDTPRDAAKPRRLDSLNRLILAFSAVLMVVCLGSAMISSRTQVAKGDQTLVEH